MNDKLFYSIWRNSYLRSCIRNRVCQYLVIEYRDIEHLHGDRQYLSLFSNRDKKEYGIFIKLIIRNIDKFNEYNSSKSRELVNDLVYNDTNFPDYEIPQCGLDCSLIAHGVERFSCYFDELTECIGRLPDTVTELDVMPNNFHNNFTNTALDDLLANLPSSLHTLSLPSSYEVSADSIELPQSLVNLCYKTNNVKNLRKLILPSNLFFQGNEVIVDTVDDLQWLHNQPWINSMTLNDLQDVVMGVGMIPQHINELEISNNHPMEEGVLPQGLWSLKYRSSVPITHLSLPKKLTFIYFDSVGIQFEKDMLPPTLETLLISDYYLPLLPGVLPHGLIKLNINTFNQQLDVDVLPQSLGSLSLLNFNQELKPFVLPHRLRYLTLNQYTGTIVQNALPNQLVQLIFPQYTGSFQHVPQLPQLYQLNILRLDSSVSRVISNCNIIKITFVSIDPAFDIQDSLIERLELNYIPNRIPLSSKWVPKQVKILHLSHLDVTSKDLIPRSCVQLTSDIHNLNLTPTSQHRSLSF